MCDVRSKRQNYQPEPDFHGAAVVTADGREIPITEDMVRESLNSLHQAWCDQNGERQVAH